MEAALRSGEGQLGHVGSLLVSTGRFTGRSPDDKYIVRRPSNEDEVWWERNAALDPGAFAQPRADMVAHLFSLEVHVQDLRAGADPDLRINVNVVIELAWHALFIRHLLRRPPAEALDDFAPD